MPSDASWPQFSGTNAIPLIQIVRAEVPCCPIQLQPYDVVQVFIDPNNRPNQIASNGDGFLVNCHTDATLLRPVLCEPVFDRPKKFPIHWEKGKPEGPVWDEAADFLDANLTSLFVNEENCFGVYSNRYFGHAHTKVGGWATYIQGPPIKSNGAFVLQVASEEKPNWMIGDNGKFYFYVDDAGNWQMHWDCY